MPQSTTRPPARATSMPVAMVSALPTQSTTASAPRVRVSPMTMAPGGPAHGPVGLVGVDDDVGPQLLGQAGLVGVAGGGDQGAGRAEAAEGGDGQQAEGPGAEDDLDAALAGGQGGPHGAGRRARP